jgi:hypothetical protein
MGFYRDMPLVCRSCGATFIFTAGEQEYYSSRGLLNEPTRCPACRRRPPERPRPPEPEPK